MLSYRRQYRILGTAAIFALIGVAFYSAFLGATHWVAVESKGIGFTLKSGHPRPFSIPWLLDDPVAFWTCALFASTTALFSITVWMARAAEKSSAAALKASTQQTATLIATERPYITGGGGFTIEVDYDYTENPPGSEFQLQAHPYHKKTFHVNVANYGKTPALLTHFDVQFRHPRTRQSRTH